MEDKEIVDLYLKRDENAITATKTKFGKYILTIAQNILGSVDDAQEVENDTYLKTWNSIPPTIPLKLKTYLGRISRNLSIDMYRKNTNEKHGGGNFEALIDELAESLPAQDASPDEALDSAALSRALSEFLKSQDSDKRVMFIKRYWYGASIDDIASELSLSPNNVTVTLHRTRAALKEYLESEGIAV
ncbi:MAG: RNA polymerase sigma factor [Clostridia bacterium]|nr:RNA polymerase sigma factor [Clostridia bacterium]